MQAEYFFYQSNMLVYQGVLPRDLVHLNSILTIGDEKKPILKGRVFQIINRGSNNSALLERHIYIE